MSGAGGLRKHGHTTAGDGGTISVLTNPMTTPADLIVGGTAGAPARLAKGSDGQVLTVDPTTHLLVWATNPAGFSDPMTTRGDIIIRNSSNATARLAVGANQRFVGSDGTDVAYRQVTHTSLSSVGADDHHNQSHNHSVSGDGTSLSPATLVIPGATSPAQTAEGSAVWDTDDDKLTIGTGAARKTLMNVGDDPTAHAASHKSGGGDSIKLNEFANPTANVNLNSNRITSLADPSASQDAATKNYVDGVSGAGITVEEEDASPSVSNVVTIKVTNGTLTDNGSGSVSIDTGGGSSDAVLLSSGYGSVTIPGIEGDGRQLPASPNGADQEFDAALSGGTTLGSPTTQDAHSTRPSHLYIKKASTTTNVVGYYWAWTPSNGDIWTTFQPWFHGGGNSRSGLFVAEASPGKIISIGKGQSDALSPPLACKIVVDVWTNPTTYSSTPNFSSLGVHPREGLFLRVVYNSSTSIDYQYSFDGYVWFTLTAAHNPSMTVASIGLMVEPESADVYAMFDFLRKS